MAEAYDPYRQPHLVIPFFREYKPFQMPLTGTGVLAGSFPDGITSIEGEPTPATVRVLFRPEAGHPGDGAVVAEVKSNPDGTWRVEGLNPELKFDVVGRKNGFNDVIMSDISPYSSGFIQLAGGFSLVRPDRNRLEGGVTVVGGQAPFTVSVIGEAPGGIQFAYVNGAVEASGTTTDWGDFDFGLRVEDVNGVWAETQVELESVDGQWDKVVALLPLDGDYEDETGWLWEKQGVAATFIDTDEWGGALRFTGDSGNALQAAPGNEGHRLSYDDDWTVEMQVKLTAESTGSRVVISRGRNGTTLSFWMSISLTAVRWTQSRNGSGGSTESYNVPFAFTPDEWYHVAVVGQGRFLSMFVNGIKIGEREFLLVWNNPSTADALRVGSLDYGSSYSYWFIGDVAQVRTTKGVARYTEDFTPPKAPF